MTHRITVAEELRSDIEMVALRKAITTFQVAKPTVTGSKGANAALTSLIAALVSLGLITDTTS